MQRTSFAVRQQQRNHHVTGPLVLQRNALSPNRAARLQPAAIFADDTAPVAHTGAVSAEQQPFESAR